MRLLPAVFNALLWLLGPAQANEFSAIGSISSNYFYRGYSKSDNTPTVRGNVEYGANSWLYVGSWVSRVDFGDSGFTGRSNVEFYPYAGVKFKLAESWQLDTSASRYIYDGRLFGRESDYNEYGASLQFKDLITTRIAFSDNLYNRGRSALNYELSGRYPITRNLESSAGMGFYQANSTLAYDSLYWNLGLTWFFKYAAVDLRYVDVAHISHSRRADTVNLPELKYDFVFSLSIGF